MANPKDYPRKIRYDVASGDVQEVFGLSMPVRPLAKYERDQMPGGGNADLIAQIMEAIGSTAEFQYIRMKMAGEQAPGVAGGEGASDAPSPTMMQGRLDAMAGHGQPPAAMVEREKYDQLGKPGATDGPERYDRRDQAHGAVLASYDDHNESRRAISDRAADYAVRHGCDYDTALAAIGGSRPRVHLPTASPV